MTTKREWLRRAKRLGAARDDATLIARETNNTDVANALVTALNDLCLYCYARGLAK